MNRAHPFLALAALCLLAPAAQATTVTKQAGNVKADLSYTKGKRFSFDFKNVTLSITRAGQVVQSGAVTPGCVQCPVEPAESSPGGSLSVEDIDADGEQEVLLQLFTGGAHCCTQLMVYGFDPGTGKYLRAFHDFGNTGYDLADLNGDGAKEIETRDDRGAYEFTAYAFSAFPIQIFAYRNRMIVDVTREFPGLVRKDAAHWLKAYRHSGGRARYGAAAVRAPLFAYLADLWLLGQGSKADSFLKAQAKKKIVKKRDPGWPAGARFVKSVNAYLERFGYKGALP